MLWASRLLIPVRLASGVELLRFLLAKQVLAFEQEMSSDSSESMEVAMEVLASRGESLKTDAGEGAREENDCIDFSGHWVVQQEGGVS